MTQRKLIGIIIGIAFVFVAAGVFVYLPARKKVRRLQEEISVVEGQINMIQSSVGGGAELDSGVKGLDARYRELISRFPPREEKGLALLYELARKLNLEVTTLTSQPKAVFNDANKQEFKVDGKVCQRLAVSITMRGLYMDAHEYIVAIQEALPVYVTVERLRMVKSGGAIPGTLMINLDITLYLLS